MYLCMGYGFVRGYNIPVVVRQLVLSLVYFLRQILDGLDCVVTIC
jgi:hypothetical protein